MAIKTISPYIPSFLKAALTETRPQQLTFKDLANNNSNVQDFGSFKYEPLNYPLKSTQQLNTDWSKFENHTFFSSAEVKVNIAFDQIINGYPFDGTKKEVETFFEKLTGFEKWIFDQFPKFAGELHFSGTQVGEDPSNGYMENLGTWISVKDREGWLYPDLSKNSDTKRILNPPADKSFTIESNIFLPNQSNDTQIIYQKMSSDKLQGFTIHIEPSITNECDAIFSVISGSASNWVKSTLKKGQFNHICASLNRENGKNNLEFFVNGNYANSEAIVQIGKWSDTSNLLIGSGSSFYVNNATKIPTQTLSGSLDELRIFHSYRNQKQQKLYESKGLYADPDVLKLYYRFNEPPVQLSSDVNDSVNAIVLDYSGNSLHSTIANFDYPLRLSSSADEFSLMTNERSEFKIILFPYHPDVITLNKNLLISASLYDQENPNLITKLIPRHYLREGALFEGYANTSIEGSIGDAYSGQGIPGQGEIGSAQVMITLLYIWAKFFDEIKMFVDAFRTLRSVDYDNNETMPNNFLNDFIKQYGFYLPPFFNNSNLNQYVEGEDITSGGVANLSLKEIQSQLLRRILINMPDIVSSKGTQHSIRSFLRSVGIDPDNSLRIREFGGPSVKHFGSSRETKTARVPIVNFTTSSIISTPFLSASRIEPGYPTASGPFLSGISTNNNDGLLTSGSWTFEGLYRYGPGNSIVKDQSLVRFEITGSSIASQPGTILNIIAPIPTGKTGSIHAYIRPGDISNLDDSPLLKLSLDVDIFNGDRWNISVGCNRNDSVNSLYSSSYFLRAATQDAGNITEIYTTSSLFYEGNGSNVFRELNPLLNASGSRITIGNTQNGFISTDPSYIFLNSSVDVPQEASAASFTGQVSNVKFWSKGLTEEEWREHVKNYKSTGVDDPLTNYNYVTNKYGSFERLRLSSLEKQEESFSDENGKITFIDFSENNFHMNGSGFLPSSKVFNADMVGYSYISPYFDEFSSSEKVRIRSFNDENNLVDSPWAELTPVVELPPGEIPLDDPRLSIEFSLIDSLNRDIVNMFANLDAMSTAIGSPELQFSPDYPDLEKLRNVYFNRIKEKLNFKGFFEFYRWFDTSIGTFINQLVPKKTRFKGTNFVIESHMLERHKLEYQSSEIYLGDSFRSRIKDFIVQKPVEGNIFKI